MNINKTNQNEKVVSPVGTEQNNPEDFIAEIISIGDEITSGTVVDTNSAWLSADLADLGIRTLFHSTVGDELLPMTEAFRMAARRSNLIIVSGGIGPTEDDLTRKAVAEAFESPLKFHETSFEHIRRHFEKRGKTMPESNRIQACFPEDSEIIVNPHGTAPGFLLDSRKIKIGRFGSSKCENDKRLENDENCSNGVTRPFCLLVFPGVPAEMKEMWIADGRKRAVEFAHCLTGRNRFVLSKKIHCFGMGESELEEHLGHLIARTHTPTVGITVKSGIITLRIRAEGSSEERCHTQIEETRQYIFERVGDLVFGEDDETLPGVVSAKLRAFGKRAAVLDWGTRGLLATKIEQDVFCGGIVSPFSGTFDRIFIDETAERFPDSDYILVIGPWPDLSGKCKKNDDDLSGKNDDVLVGLFDRSTGVFIEKYYTFGGHPAIIDSVFCYRALDLLRRRLNAH